MKIHDLQEVVLKARTVFEVWSHTREGGFLVSEGFPDGCCGSSSDLLICYLDKYHNQRNVQYINGVINECCHGWIEVCGYSVDITADQFNKYGFNYQPVICCDPLDYPLLPQLRDIKKGYGIGSSDPSFGEFMCLADKLNKAISAM